MKKFQDKEQLKRHFSREEYPKELQAAANEAIQAVESCNKGGGTPSYLVLAETQTEASEVERTFSLTSAMPESDVCITAVSGESWRERVFVFGDSGNGVIIYERVPFVDENDTELQRKT